MLDQRTIDGKLTSIMETVWLVMESEPDDRTGYKIVVNEQEQVFGLAHQNDADNSAPLLCGYCGDFPTTLAAM